jgi:hypothetical protein
VAFDSTNGSDDVTHTNAPTLSQDYAQFSIGADLESQVFYNREYLVQKWSRFANVRSVTPEAYAYQTAVLVQKHDVNP